MTELQQIDFSYLIKEYYPLSQQIENKRVKASLDWIVDLIIPDIVNKYNCTWYSQRFLGALQMANGMELIPLEVYLPMYNWSLKLNLFLKGYEL